MNAEHLQLLARWQLRNNHRWVWSGATSLILGIVIALLIVRGNAENPKVNLADSTKEMLAHAPPRVSDELNAALNYEKAFNAHIAFPGLKDDAPETNIMREGSFFDHPAVRAHITANFALYDEVEAAAKKHDADWKLDYNQ